ncbi:MAG: 30S ribosomal protein S17 [Pseudomonadota bacterium]
MPKRILQGTVVSDKTDKTIVVKVERRFNHPLFKKVVRRSKNYQAHDADNQFKTGDQVFIEECKPISKTKRWTVLAERSQSLAR